MPEPVPPRTSTIRKHSARVLIVDDHVDSADVIAVLLESRGHTTCAAYTADDAMRLAIEFKPEVVLLDLSLGAHSGYDLADAFRLHDALRDCRLVAMTGHAEEAAHRRSEAAGFHRHLVKPVYLEALLEAVAGEDERPSCAPPAGWTKRG